MLPVRFLLAIISVFLLLGVSPLKAESPQPANFSFNDMHQECGLRLGFGQSFDSDETINFYSLLPRWGIFLTQPGNSYLGNVRLSLVVEGIIGAAEAHRDGWEAGITPLLKISYPITHRLLGYIEGGAGIIFENIDSPAVDHTFNFSPQVGAGVDFHLTNGYALSLAYRFRHVSNAGIYDENQNLNAHFVQFGIIYYFR